MRAPVWIAGLFAAFGTASTALAAPPELAYVPNGFVKISAVELGAGESLESPDARCSLCMQDDGNLVLKWRERVLWNTKTAGTTDARLRLQSDGNLVVYGKKDGVEKALWQSGTSGAERETRLVCQSDGNLVLLEVNGAERKVIWSTETIAAIPAKFTLKVTRPGAILGKFENFDICVNGTVIGKIGNKDEKTFEVDGYIGRNNITAFSRTTGHQYFPNLVDKDKENKLAGFRFFAVNQPGDTIALTLGFNDDNLRDNPYTVSQEVPHDWQAPDIVDVKFDKNLIDEVKEAQPKILIRKGDVFEHTERVTHTQRVVLSESFQAGASVRGKVVSLTPSGVATLEGRIHTEYKRASVQETTTEKLTQQVHKIAGDGQYVRVTEFNCYRTGTMTVYIDGYKHEVPFKVLVGTVTRPVVVNE